MGFIRILPSYITTGSNFTIEKPRPAEGRTNFPAGRLIREGRQDILKADDEKGK